MRFLLAALIVILCSKTVFSQSLTSATDSLIHTLDKKLPKLIQQNKVPGIALAILDNNKFVYTKGYGFSNLKNGTPITSSTGFNIGSISKLFTAFAIIKLVDEDKIELDSPVENYLTRWKLPNSKYNNSKITIRHLLNHTAGVSVHGYNGFNTKDLLPSLESSLNGNKPARHDEKVEIIIEPQTEFKYSGGGYTILQLVIEEVTHIPFEKYMDKAVFKPLKMKNTSFKITKRVLKTSAIPYDEHEKEIPFVYFTAKAAAGLQTTLNDFIKFTNEILNNHTLLSKEKIDMMTQASQLSKNRYGLGFKILQLGKIKLKGHSGTNSGWQAAFFIDFKNKNGLIMMTNGDNGDRVLKKALGIWARAKYQ
ncbi:serine hydrolase domain-containing protein [Hyunsoonleella pacifica]|uniref:Class A beta-lactamase-related serine hydrolase n=1 Tax=Hyunsoonleella pacifica TaxID=1080224 RepID=A0A4Q9FPJ8_9FLAO|nr:serine hydrolase domain-containing protein [Hyunsoonleella pacifica]TBN14579.1 class A beta-lactamase-related serine hydrolase [Hyunsoonleella pacifica]GGD14971.1 hypothetical protein GCM10011368_16140 [Hyunsoonleella pacifica]